MKRMRFYMLFLFIAGSCVQVIEEPLPEEKEPEIISDRPPVCSDEWEVLLGDFDLFRTWTFIGFEHTSRKGFSQLTCMAKLADFALNGEIFEDISPIDLTFICDKGCQINTFDIPWVANTIGFNFYGCLTKTQAGIVVWEDSNRRILLDPPARNTIPVLEFDTQFIRGITGATIYIIKENRLYLYGGLEHMAMVFGTSN